MNEYIWIIGGGPMQLPIIQAAKARGYRIIVTDRDPNPVAKSLVDALYQIDTYDVFEHLDLAKRTVRKGIKVIGVVADAIDVAPTAAAVAEYLGLPTVGYRAACLAGNKADFRALVTNNHPPYFVVGEPEEFATEIYIKWLKRSRYEDIGLLPCVVKSVDNCASRGVTLVTDLDEFAIAIEYARANNKHDKRIIVEQFCAGVEYSTDWWVGDNASFILQTNGAKRIFDPNIFGMERMYTNPWRLEELDARALEVARIIQHQGGPLKLDWTYNENYGWLLMEAACRWSGGFDHTNARVLSCGSSGVEQLLNWATGQYVDITSMRIPELHRWACGISSKYKAGKVASWQMPTGIPDAYIINRELSVIPEAKDCSHRPVFIIAGGDTEDIAITRATEISSQVQPVYAAK